MAALKLENARYLWHNGYPLLSVLINGREARLDTEWKPSLREQGIVPVGAPFDDELTAEFFNDEDGSVRQLRGCTKDRRLFELYRRFWEAESITPGPVPIPEE